MDVQANEEPQERRNDPAVDAAGTFIEEKKFGQAHFLTSPRRQPPSLT
jgi:hypothetical protein